MVRRKGRSPEPVSPLPGYGDLVEIGGGAFATVYRATEVETGRAVALKILKVDTIHAHLIETFQQEIQALAAVSDHPNIVTLYRPTSTSDGRPVLVLELCRESLAQQLRAGGPMDPAVVTRVGIRISGALETAHRNGFLHRDMKPQNILVTQFGEPALADFGVAALQASAQMTAGVFGFTTLHAAPEMLEGHHLSPATDVYGLASTMYQLLNGQAPFATFDNEAPASVILRILRDPVRPLRSPQIPFALGDLLERALSKQPEGRPRSALEFALALQEVEAAQGWPETSFVAWGEEGRGDQLDVEAPAERGPMGVVADNGPGRRRRLAPAPLERSPWSPGPQAEPGHPGPDAVPVPSAGPVRPAGTDPAPLGGSIPPPPAPAPPVRPGLAVAGVGERRVIDPVGDSTRAPGPVAVPEAAGATPAPVNDRPAAGSAPVPPVSPPTASLAPPAVAVPPVTPTAVPPVVPQSPPPRFSDPDPASVDRGETVYEQTMGVHQLLASPAGAADISAPARQRIPPWAIAVFAAAAVIVAAAVLLAAGVL